MSADIEAAARMLAHREGWAFAPNSEMKKGDLAALEEYKVRAEAALTEVQCSLLGRSCTCWTFADFVAADERLRAGATA